MNTQLNEDAAARDETLDELDLALFLSDVSRIGDEQLSTAVSICATCDAPAGVSEEVWNQRLRVLSKTLRVWIETNEPARFEAWTMDIQEHWMISSMSQFQRRFADAMRESAYLLQAPDYLSIEKCRLLQFDATDAYLLFWFAESGQHLVVTLTKTPEGTELMLEQTVGSRVARTPLKISTDSLIEFDCNGIARKHGDDAVQLWERFVQLARTAPIPAEIAGVSFVAAGSRRGGEPSLMDRLTEKARILLGHAADLVSVGDISPSSPPLLVAAQGAARVVPIARATLSDVRFTVFKDEGDDPTVIRFRIRIELVDESVEGPDSAPKKVILIWDDENAEGDAVEVSPGAPVTKLIPSGRTGKLFAAVQA